MQWFSFISAQCLPQNRTAECQTARHVCSTHLHKVNHRYTNCNFCRVKRVNVVYYFLLLNQQVDTARLGTGRAVRLWHKMIVPCSESAVEITNEQYHCGTILWHYTVIHWFTSLEGWVYVNPLWMIIQFFWLVDLCSLIVWSVPVS